VELEFLVKKAQKGNEEAFIELIGILINNCNDFIKNSKKIVCLDELALQGQKCGEFEKIELKEIFNSLDGNLKLIVQLYYIEDISVKDIARLTNIPEGTVKSRLYRARRVLSELFMDGRGSYAGDVK
jgi:RNA polymerase sigma-70 factor (ECF subfamily)